MDFEEEINKQLDIKLESLNKKTECHLNKLKLLNLNGSEMQAEYKKIIAKYDQLFSEIDKMWQEEKAKEDRYKNHLKPGRHSLKITEYWGDEDVDNNKSVPNEEEIDKIIQDNLKSIKEKRKLN